MRALSSTRLTLASLAAATAAALLGAACAGLGDPGGDDDPGDERLAREEYAASVPPQCTAAELSWPATTPAGERVCDGQWEYQSFKHPCTGPERQTCRHPDHGIESESVHTGQTLVTGRKNMVQVGNYNVPLFVYDGGVNCYVKGQQMYDALLPISKGNSWLTVTPGAMEYGGNNGELFFQYCDYRIDRFPTFKSKAQSDSCPLLSPWNSCQNPAFGLASSYTPAGETLWVTGYYWSSPWGQLPIWNNGVTCNVAAQQRFDQLAPPPHRGNASYTVSISGTYNWGSSFYQSCAFQAYNLPVWQSGQGQVCGSRCPSTMTTLATGEQACIEPRPDHSCGTNPGTLFGAAGQTEPSTSIAHAVPGAACTSGEHMPANTPAERAALFAHLRAQWQRVSAPPAGFDAALARPVLARKLMLFLELHGHELSAADADFVIGLYGANPAEASTCAETAIPDAPGCDAAAVAAATPTLAMCQKLRGEHAADAAVEALWTRCLDGLEQVAALGGQSCDAQLLIEAYDEIAAALAIRQLERPVPALAGDAYRAELQRRLAIVDAWYVSASARFASLDEAGREPLARNTSAVLGAFWRGVNGDDLSAVDPSNPATVVNLANVRMERERAVLLAAYTPMSGGGLPLTSAPLAALTADGLRAMHRRLAEFASLHDLGCLYKGCSAATASPQSQSWGLLAAVGDKSLLSTRLTAAALVDVGWKSVFQAIAQQHAALDAALTDALGADAAARLIGTEVVREPVRELAAIVRDARLRYASFERTGLFDAGIGTRMRRALRAADLDALMAPPPDLGGIPGRQAELAEAVDEYQAGLTSLVAALMDIVQHQRDAESLRGRLEQLLLQESDVEDQINALRTVEAADALRFADFSRAFGILVNTATDPAAASVKNHVVFTATPQQARFQLQNYTSGLNSLRPDALARLGDMDALERTLDNAVLRDNGSRLSIPVQKGDVVNVKVSGRWSPTCAMQRWNWGQWNQAKQTLIDGSVETGPEGFMLTAQESEHAFTGHTSSYTESHSKNYSVSARACGGVRAEYFAYIDIQTCVGYQEDWTYTTAEVDNHGTGFESRTTGAFPLGVRLPVTPMSYLPAGSLVMVQARPETHRLAELTHATVLQERTSVQVTEDGVLSFIVNDVVADGCSGMGGALTVEVDVLQPTGRFAKVFGAAMAEQLKKLRTETALYLDRGRLLGSEQAAWETNAWNALNQACVAQLTSEGLTAAEIATQCDRAQLPTILMDYFRAWLSRELVHRERMVELAALKRRREALLLELETVRAEFVQLESRGRLGQLMAVLRLRHLDGEHLREKMGTVTALLTDDLYPFLRLRYPKALEDLRNGSAGPQLQELIQADWTRPIDQTAEKLDGLTSAILLEVADERAHQPAIGVTTVAISFAKPTANPATLVFTQADEARAKAVWDELLATRTATLTITADDLWGPGASATLSCFEEAPVVRSAAIFLPSANPADKNRNGLNVRADVGVGAEMQFTTGAGPVLLAMVGGEWLVDQLRVIWGPVQEMEQLHAQYGAPTAAFAGRAAANRWRIDMTKLPVQLLQSATQVVLILEVETRTAGAPLAGVGVCQ